MLGTGRIAWQKDLYAMYAEVSVEVETIENGPCRIFIPDSIDSSWVSGIKYGFQVFQEVTQGLSGMENGISVQVREVHGQSVDTTEMSMAYATFHAIEDAIKLGVAREFYLDEDTGQFHIAG